MDKYSPNTVVQNYWIPNIVQNYWKGLLLHSVDIHTFEKQHAAFPYVSKYDLFFFFFYQIHCGSTIYISISEVKRCKK